MRPLNRWARSERAAVFLCLRRRVLSLPATARPSCGIGFRTAAYGLHRAARPEFRRTLRGGIVGKHFSVWTLLLSTLVGVAPASAQQRQITGRVSAATGEPVAGVTAAATRTPVAAGTHPRGP